MCCACASKPKQGSSHLPGALFGSVCDGGGSGGGDELTAELETNAETNYRVSSTSPSRPAAGAAPVAPTGSLRAPSASIPSSGHSLFLLSFSFLYRFSNHCPKKPWGGDARTDNLIIAVMACLLSQHERKS